MKVKKDTFDPQKNNEVLTNFSNHLLNCGFNFTFPITRVILDPTSIMGIEGLIHIKHKSKPQLFIGSILSIITRVDIAKFTVFDSVNNYIDIETGIPTKKGYKSKAATDDFLCFDVNQNLHLTTNSIEIIRPFVRKFKIWDDSYDTSNNTENQDLNKPEYSKYNGIHGYGDNTIDDAFEGDPDNCWNVE